MYHFKSHIFPFQETRETSSEFVESIISALFHNTPNKDDNYITEALLSDCTPTKQYKHVLRLLKSLASLEVLEPLLELRSVFNTYSDMMHVRLFELWLRSGGINSLELSN